MSGPLLKSWRSWPGFLLVACEGLSRLYREITNYFFNISWIPKHQVCWNPTGGNTLSLSGPESHTKGPAKSQVHETTTVLHTVINNIFLSIIFTPGVWKLAEKSSLWWHETHSSEASPDKPSYPTDFIRHLNRRNKSNHTAAASPTKAYFVSSAEMFVAIVTDSFPPRITRS